MKCAESLAVALLILNFSNFSLAQTIKNKICARRSSDSACQQLGRSGQLACNFNLHNVDCLLNIQYGRSHIGRIEPEEAFLAAPLLNDSVVVLGTIETRFRPPQTVVVVRNDISSGFSNLRGKKLCHPGFNHDSAISRFILQELEDKIIELNDSSFCTTDNITLVEKRIKALSEFFGPSCRPGLWTQDTQLDQTLKDKYWNLCNQCGPNKCGTYYKVPFNESLKCLEAGGDIAITTLHEAERFFNISTNINDYRYLDKNGNVLSAQTPYIWTEQLPSLIVADRNSADEIKNFVSRYIQTNVPGVLRGVSDKVVVDALNNILGLHPYQNVSFSNNYSTLKNYVNAIRKTPTINDIKSCDKSIKWCTNDDSEHNKCLWLSQAALNQDIIPPVQCVRSSRGSSGNSELSCLDDIESSVADVFVASADYGYLSRKKGLVGLAYPETDYNNLSTILVAYNPDVNQFKSLSDLKGKKACFPDYGGKEFLAFIKVAHSLKLMEEICDYGKILGDFLDNSCLPGARDYQKAFSENIDSNKLCGLCVPTNLTSTASYCNADSVNKYFGSNGALRCLDDKISDFVVVTRQDLSSLSSNYRVICKNSSLATYTGFDVDEDCALTVITASEIVSRSDNPLNPDIILALREFEKQFGTNLLQKPFNLFDQFNGTLNGLFLDSTPGISFTPDSKYIRNYENIQWKTNCQDDDDDGGGAAGTVLFHTLLLVLPVYLIIS